MLDLRFWPAVILAWLAVPVLAQPIAPATPIPAAPGPVPDETAPAVVLNRQIQARNDAIWRANAEREAAWRREVDKVAAENARRAAEFAAQNAAHQAEMAKWCATTGGMMANATQVPPAPPAIAAPGPSAKTQLASASPAPPVKRTCRSQLVTGSLTQRIRVCSTAQERKDMSDNVRRNWGGARVSACGGPSCDR